MPLTGPTPADWIANQNARQDENMRMMMQIAMASKQYEDQKKRYEETAQHQSYQDMLDTRRTAAYEESILNPRPTGPTDLMRNYEFLQGQYPGQDVGPMIVPGMKPQNQPEGYQYDIDPTTAAEMEKEFRLPPGTVSKMGPRQREDAFTQYQSRRFPKPDTNTPVSATPAGRQKDMLNTLLQDIEQRRSSMITRHDADRRSDPESVDEGGFRKGLSEMDRQVQTVRGALMAIAARGQELTSEEWDDLNKKINTSGGGYSEMAIEIAEEMGISPEAAEAYIKKATGGTPTGVSKRE